MLKSVHQKYRNGTLFIEGVPVERIAREVGTPCYVYSTAEVVDAFSAYEKAFRNLPHLTCYALKANSNLALGNILAKRGAGADIVSAGELYRALRAGFPAQRIIFSGVGKTTEELSLALKKGVRLINVESAEELRALNHVARRLRRVAPVSLRVNPDVRAGGHPHISTGTPENKFGVDHKNIFPLYQWAVRQKYLRAVGIQCHIGSQIVKVAPYRRALLIVLDLIRRLREVGVRLEIVDLGGGLGVVYNSEAPDSPAELAKVLVRDLKGTGLELFLEPGRSLVAQAGVLLTRVLYRKDAGRKQFVIVDAAMNDLARPALYDAYHEVVPVRQRRGRKIVADVVGPVCESGDYLARSRPLVLPERGDVLAVLTAGAYGFAMSSQYNARPRGAEVLINGSRFDVVRRRESFEDLVRGEVVPRAD